MLPVDSGGADEPGPVLVADWLDGGAADEPDEPELLQDVRASTPAATSAQQRSASEEDEVVMGVLHRSPVMAR